MMNSLKNLETFLTLLAIGLIIFFRNILEQAIRTVFKDNLFLLAVIGGIVTGSCLLILTTIIINRAINWLRFQKAMIEIKRQKVKD